MAKFAQEARMNGKIYAPRLQKDFKNTRLGFILSSCASLSSVAITMEAMIAMLHPDFLRKPSRRRIALNLYRGPCKESFKPLTGFGTLSRKSRLA